VYRRILRLAILLLPLTLLSLLYASENFQIIAAESDTEGTPIYLPLLSAGGSSLPPIIPHTTKSSGEETTQQLLALSPEETQFTFANMTSELAALSL
jgi:hypothetical protein